MPLYDLQFKTCYISEINRQLPLLRKHAVKEFYLQQQISPSNTIVYFLTTYSCIHPTNKRNNNDWQKRDSTTKIWITCGNSTRHDGKYQAHKLHQRYIPWICSCIHLFHMQRKFKLHYPSKATAAARVVLQCMQFSTVYLSPTLL